MKKIFTIAIALLSVVGSYAVNESSYTAKPQSQKVAQPAVKRAEPKSVIDVKSVAPRQIEVKASTERKANWQNIVRDLKGRQPGKALAPRRVPSQTLEAFYDRPLGTFFAGLDRAGYAIFTDYPVVLGAWNSGVETWLWENGSIGASSFTWNNLTSKHGLDIKSAFESWAEGYGLTGETYEYYANYYGIYNVVGRKFIEDENHNLIDSVTPAHKGNEVFWTSYTKPVLIASNEAEADTFAIGTAHMGRKGYKSPIDSIMNVGWTMAGAENIFIGTRLAPLGYWPMTNVCPNLMYRTEYVVDGDSYKAVTVPDTLGGNFEFYEWLDEDNWGYIYGSNEMSYVKYDPELDNGEGEEKGGWDFNNLVNVKPDVLFVSFEKPQAPLYVHDITLPIFAWTADGERAIPVFNGISIQLYDEEFNPLLDAPVTATIADTTTCALTDGQMLTFNLKEVDEYGEVVSEGIVLDKAFFVSISGLAEDGNNVAILSGADPYYNGHTVMYDADGNLYSQFYYDPLINLNGVFNTLELIHEPVEEGQVHQDLDVEMVYDDEEAAYIALFTDAESGNQYLPAFYATFLPKDTLNNNYNYDHYSYIYPDKYVLDFQCQSYEYTYSSGETEIVNDWDDEGYAVVYILANEGDFHQGDEITVASHGRSITFHVTNGEPTALENVKQNLSRIERNGDNFTLHYTDQFNKVDVIGANGQLVGSYQLPKGGHTTIDASGFANGVYIFRLFGDKVNEVLRAVK